MKRLETVSIVFIFSRVMKLLLISLHSLFHLFRFALRWKWAVAHFAAFGDEGGWQRANLALLQRFIHQPVDFQTFFAFILLFFLSSQWKFDQKHFITPVLSSISPPLLFFLFGFCLVFLPCSCKVLVFHEYKLKHYYQSE